MSILENILYGLISGVAEFLPVSARGHQALLRYLFGLSTRASLSDLLVHIGVLFSVLIACRESLGKLYREQRSTSSVRRKRSRYLESRSYYDLRLLKTATPPLLFGMLLYITTAKLEDDLLPLIAFFVLNGSILLTIAHTRRGNRDSRSMSGLDGIVMGISGALSVFPGVSRTGMVMSYASLRGADSQSSVNWAILLGIPATVFAIGYDVVSIVTVGVGVTSTLLIVGAIIAGLAAFCGGYIAIAIMRMIAAQADHSQFAYYSFGVAMLVFILYLLT